MISDRCSILATPSATRLSALWLRGEARDYIDTHTVVTSERFNRSGVLAIADEFEAAPLDRFVPHDLEGVWLHPEYAKATLRAYRADDLYESRARSLLRHTFGPDDLPAQPTRPAHAGPHLDLRIDARPLPHHPQAKAKPLVSRTATG